MIFFKRCENFSGYRNYVCFPEDICINGREKNGCSFEVLKREFNSIFHHKRDTHYCPTEEVDLRMACNNYRYPIPKNGTDNRLPITIYTRGNITCSGASLLRLILSSESRVTWVNIVRAHSNFLFHYQQWERYRKAFLPLEVNSNTWASFWRPISRHDERRVSSSGNKIDEIFTNGA